MAAKPSGRRVREGWLLRAERISDAYGLVLVLVLTTYVLASLLSNHGWSGVILTLSASATSVIALTSSEAHRLTVRAAIVLSALAVVMYLAVSLLESVLRKGVKP